MSNIDKKEFNKQVKTTISQLNKKLRSTYLTTIEELSELALSVPNPKAPFRFSDYPQLNKRVEVAIKHLATQVEATVINGVRMADGIAEDRMSHIVEQVYIFGNGADVLDATQIEEWFKSKSTLGASEEFAKRRINGLGLSERVWDKAKLLTKNVEVALELGIQKGISAAELTKEVTDALNQPNRIFRRVKQVDGTFRLSKNAKAYHPGQGVYRSSYKNALRLTSNEINMAYRSAFGERIKPKKWITGKRIQLSNNHSLKGSDGKLVVGWKDECDYLQGVYPKNFEWFGWHIRCRCEAYIVHQDPLQAIEEFKTGKSTAVQVTESPKVFDKWVKENSVKIKEWDKKGTLPYFLRDNPDFMNKVLNK